MIIAPKQPRNDKTRTRLSRLVPYMLRGKGEERCTWYMAGNLPGLERQEDAGLAVEVMELLQEGNTRAKGSKTYHLVISFHPEDRRLTVPELEDVVRRTLQAAGLAQHQYIAVRHSDQEHEHLHVAVNKIHPETLKIHHPYQAIPAYQALASLLEQELGLHRVDRTRGRSQRHRTRDFEAHQGLESFSSWARRTIGEVAELDRIASWPALHGELQRFGVRLMPRGNGPAIVHATRPNLACKASSLGRDWSKARLCERYGEFVPGPRSSELAREERNGYEGRPLGTSRDDSLWHEYQEVLCAARSQRLEQREALARKVDAARAAHQRDFTLKHHAVAALPLPAKDKRKHYKALSFERKVAERRLRATIQGWRTVRFHTHPGSWKQFLAERAARGDPRAIRRLERQWNGLAITSQGKQLGTLQSSRSRSSRGTLIHNLPGGVRLRESPRAIELLGDAHDQALKQLVNVAKQRFGSRGITITGRKDVRRRLERLAAERGLEITQERER
ncbi:MAG: TraI/MobA(P) family conjugative relaxase [Polyangiales bacterium]